MTMCRPALHSRRAVVNSCKQLLRPDLAVREGGLEKGLLSLAMGLTSLMLHSFMQSHVTQYHSRAASYMEVHALFVHVHLHDTKYGGSSP